MGCYPGYRIGSTCLVYWYSLLHSQPVDSAPGYVKPGDKYKGLPTITLGVISELVS